MDNFFDVNELLYQKFLLDIYRHCDKFALSHISPEEKEKMAVEMVDFVGKVINSLQSKKPLVNIRKQDKRKLRKISKIISTGVEKDKFARTVAMYYISKKKISKKNLEAHLTTAAIAVMSRGRKTDMQLIEKKIEKIRPYIFRVASLLSPAVSLHEKLFANPEREIQQEETLAFDTSFMKYIG